MVLLLTSESIIGMDLLVENNWNFTVYTCAFKTLKMLTILSVTIYTREHVFSKFTVVKNKLRSTMS